MLVAEILQTDVLRRVVIRVNLIPTLQTLELILSVVVWTIILVCEPTLRATLTRVRWIDLRHYESFRFGFVRDVLVQSVKRPLVNRLRVREAFADSFELLEHDMRTLVFESFLNEFVRHDVKHLLEAPRLLTTDSLDVLVCPSSPSLLERTTALLVFAVPVVEFATAPELAS